MKIKTQKKGTLSLKRMTELYKEALKHCGCGECGKEIRFVYLFDGKMIGALCDVCAEKHDKI